jgi:glycosyltransferase involved in cell wall biosynthesis
LYVVDSLGLSGKTRALTHLVTRLGATRFRGAVATFEPPVGLLADQLERARIPVLHVPSADGLRATTVGKLVRASRALKPALVHCFNPRPMLYGGLAAKALSCPAVGTLSAFACLSDEDSYPFLPQPLHTRSLRNRIRNRVVGHMMARIATVSHTGGTAFCRDNAIPHDKLRVISYGVDLEALERVSPDDVTRVRSQFGAVPGELIIGSVGRLVEQKDYPTQLVALALVARRYPVRMVIAGGGPLEHELRALADELGVADRIEWLGERDDVPSILRAIDVYLIASKFEPFGVSVLEAMGARLPIIATEVNEMPEILEQGRAGMLVPAGQPAALASAIEKLAADPARRAELGGRAQTLARERYNLRSLVDAYVGLYEELAS